MCLWTNMDQPMYIDFFPALSRMVLLIYMILGQHGTFTLEQPATSLIYRHRRMQQLFKIIRVTFLHLQLHHLFVKHVSWSTIPDQSHQSCKDVHGCCNCPFSSVFLRYSWDSWLRFTVWTSGWSSLGHHHQREQLCGVTAPGLAGCLQAS